MVKARSDNWRINKSGVMAIEGAQILRSLQKVAGAAGLPKEYKVTFATKAQTSQISFDNKSIVIGAGRLFTDAPMPADKFDVLVGLTLHEVGHQQIRTDMVEREVVSHVMGWETKRQLLFHKFVNIGEDIAIESRIRNNKNLAEYDEALHNWGVNQMRDADPYKLLDVWIEYSLGHKSTTVMSLPPELDEPMQQLVALTGWLRSPTTPYHVDRVAAYENYWKSVEDVVMNPPVPPPPPPPPESEACEDGEPSNETESREDESEPGESGEPEDGETEPEPSETKTDGEREEEEAAKFWEDKEDKEMDSQDPDAPLPGEEEVEPEPEDTSLDRPLASTEEDEMDEDLARDINNAVENEVEDVTDEVKEAFDGTIGFNVRAVLRSREGKTPKMKPNMLLRKRLERIMSIKKRLQARTMHGEQYGRIDKRHLHRVATDERIFSLKYKFPDGFPTTKILLDLSGSMSGHQADEVLEAAGALQTLVDAEVWCYNSKGSQCNLVRMDEGKLVHKYQPGGNTPSGLALVGVSLGMKKGGLIIHLTDGGHNTGESPWRAYWILEARGIEVVNVIWGGDSRGNRHYVGDKTTGVGMKCSYIKGLAEFSDALYKILVEQTKLSKMGGK